MSFYKTFDQHFLVNFTNLTAEGVCFLTTKKFISKSFDMFFLSFFLETNNNNT